MINYKKLGLKCGLEVHQQLNTGKLFCPCPSELNENQPEFTIQRYLKASAGESGEIDIAAKHEMLKNIHFIYEGNIDTSCLVELDEEPPHHLNKAALKNCLMLCKLFKMHPLDEIHVMRKVVVDGSNTSGFQRTALVALHGTVPGSKIKIDTLCLEEDACRNSGESENARKFRLDRLGIPLLEIATAPDITSPIEAQQVASSIGTALRSLPDVKRGIGTIRQDVNVSIKGGNRVEIKGAQDLELIPTIIEYEMQRQSILLGIAKKSAKILKSPEPTMKDLTKLFQKTASKLIKSSLDQKKGVFGIQIPGAKGILGTELQPNKRIATDISEYNAVIHGVKGLLHGDELPNYGITESEVSEVTKNLGCNSTDSFILVLSTKEKAQLLLASAWARLQQLCSGVPKEVRKANPDATSSFLRPMPGSNRMYPETDLSPIRIDPKEFKSLKTPALVSDIKKQLTKQGLSEDLANLLIRESKVDIFNTALKSFTSLKPAFIVDILVSIPRDVKRTHHIDTEKITDNTFLTILKALDSQEITKNAVPNLFEKAIKGLDISQEISKQSDNIITGKEIENTLRQIIKDHPGVSVGGIMGLAMKKFGNAVPGSQIATLLKKLMP